MTRSHPHLGALALAVCFLSFFAIAAGPARAVERLPDVRILSAAPFVFQADRDIFSRMPVAPADSRIFMPMDPLRGGGEARLDDRQKRLPTS